MNIQQIIDDFSYLDDWEDRYRYLIEIGKALPPLDPTEVTEDNRVRGCASQVWVVHDTQPGPVPLLAWRGQSDAHIVKGLVALVTAFYSGRTAAEVLDADAMALFADLGLKEHLTPQRGNGVRSMVERIKRDAGARI